MEDPRSAEITVGIDLADTQAASDLARSLTFAEIPIRSNLSEAQVVIGDGSTATNHRAYVHLTAEGQQPAPGLITSPPRLTPMLSAIATASSLSASRESHAQFDSVFAAYVGVSEEAVLTRELMSKAAAQDVTVLITGESGTGKEIVARALHSGSRRAGGPFVPINCGAIPAELLESELFGHEKGAFTGAITAKTGRFELAHTGTLFLDEIGDLPYPMQVKLLRTLEQKSFERLGSAQTRVADVRIVAATNKDLEAKMAAGEFREDLFYRLNVYPIELAPLRERAQDLPLLVNIMLERIQRQQGLQVRFSVDALALLAAMPWPGNVRELNNLLQRLSIQYPHGLVKTSDLPRKYTEQDSLSVNPRTTAKSGLPNTQAEPCEVLLPVNGIDLKDYLTRLERSLIEQALEDTNSVVARAADRLHIRRTTLVEKMRKHGLGRVESVQ